MGAGAGGLGALPDRPGGFGFPYAGAGSWLERAGGGLAPREAVRLLGESIVPERLERLERVAAARSFGVVPVCEGLRDPGNVAAVCRTAEALGFGAVHAVGSVEPETGAGAGALPRPRGRRGRGRGGLRLPARQSAGTHKWLHLRHWEDSGACLADARAAGFRVLVADAGPGSVPLGDVDWAAGPACFVLGNEHAGVSAEAREAADLAVRIPMRGFAESFNVSVAAALVLQAAAPAVWPEKGHPGRVAADGGSGERGAKGRAGGLGAWAGEAGAGAVASRLPGLSSEQREVLLAHYLLAHRGGDPVELLRELERRWGAARGR